MIDFSQFHFIRPAWLLLLLPVALLAWNAWSVAGVHSSWSRICDSHLLRALLQDPAQRKQNKYLKPFAVLTLILCAFAMAGPSWKQLPQPAFKNQQARVFILDLSQSMAATDLTPSRLARAKLKLTDLLRASKEGQSALIVFAAAPYVVSPLTDDANTIINMIPTLNTDLVPLQGSAPSLALERGDALLTQAAIGRGEIIMITDGADEATIQSAEKLGSQGRRVSVLGVGTEQGAPIPLDGGGFVKNSSGSIVIPRLNVDDLRDVAVAGNGFYSSLTADDRDVKTLLRDLPLSATTDQFAKSERNLDLWRDEGPWLLIAVLPLALFLFRRGVIVSVFMATLFLPPDEAMAFEWKDLWNTPDQQGMELQDAGKYKQAAEKFSEPAWKAAALYRQGEYEKAEQQYAKLESADAQYNLGNAFAKQGKLQEALKAYNNVLTRMPEHEDARHNREIIEKLLKQQQQKSEQQNSGQQKSDNSKQEQNDPKNSDQGTSQENSEAQEQDQAQGERTAQEQNDRNASNENNTENGQSDQQQNEETTDQAQAGKPDPEKDSDSAQQARIDAEQQSEYKERTQAMEQWLRRIPDDPGGLLRQKFLLQHRQQGSVEVGEPW